LSSEFDSAEWRTGALAIPMPTFVAETTCADAFEWFTQHEDQVAAAVLDEQKRVIGLVNRLKFMARYAQRYTPELYGKQPIAKLANLKPLIVDEAVSVSELGSIITLDWPDALRECFVVTSAGRYLGIGTSEALVKCKMEILAAREAQLNAALARAQDASRAKSDFLALMSHELRTPLNAIIGFSEVLANELYGPHSVKRYGEYAADIHGAGKHLLELISDILDLSKLEAGKLELFVEPLDVSEVLEDCFKFIALRAREKQLRLEARCADGLPPVLADPLRLKQVLLNVLSNAIKFTPPKGHISATAELDVRSVRIRVVDSGIGMAPEMIAIAFEPFRQVASPYARNVEGTGLGLSLVKSLTEQHGGEITLESAPGRGTTVELRFPAADISARGKPVAATA
jgi:two-component system cell cycle sensor histidine kinase PleC